MKKLLMIFAAAALTATINTGCDVDANLSEKGNKMVIDDIIIESGAWKEATVRGVFDYFYADIELPELTEYIFNKGSFHTYWRYQEERGDGHFVDVQEELPAVINLERLEYNTWIPYTETISCSYDFNKHADNYGYMRVMISRSDFFNRPPDKPYLFRTVIFW